MNDQLSPLLLYTNQNTHYPWWPRTPRRNSLLLVAVVADSPQPTRKSRVVPEDVRGRPTMKIVYVVLESQYQSSMTAEVKRINAGSDNMAVECVGYLLEELRNEDAFEQFQKDMADANIFVGSLIFVQELAEKVIEVVKPLRDDLDACLVFPSMPEVMRLNKVGSFTMKNLGQSKSVVADFMKKKKQDDGSLFEEGMLKLLRTLPKVLKFLPSDKAADARTFMMSFQYWLGGSPENLESLTWNP
jgi:magnesium chelatase subunit H